MILLFNRPTQILTRTPTGQPTVRNIVRRRENCISTRRFAFLSLNVNFLNLCACYTKYFISFLIKLSNLPPLLCYCCYSLYKHISCDKQISWSTHHRFKSRTLQKYPLNVLPKSQQENQVMNQHDFHLKLQPRTQLKIPRSTQPSLQYFQAYSLAVY